jgi:2-(3-amino-3-carboxypropyl)histidine synthase
MAEERLFPSFRVDLEEILKVITRNGYTKVMLQGPEGMKRGLLGLAEVLEERSMAYVWVDGEPCYGACDHAGERGDVLGVDALIHLGHSDIPSMERERSVPIHFFPVEMRGESEMIQGGLGRIISRLSGKKVSLFTSIQHMTLLEEIRDRLRTAGLKVHIGEPGSREEYPGQVLGCSFSSAGDLPRDVDALVFIGTGRFHPLGLAMASQREVHIMNPLTGEVGIVGKEDLDKMLRSRFGHINRFKEVLSKGEMVGVVIGFKPGQRRIALAENLRDILKEREIRTKMVVMDHMDPMKLKSLGLRLIVSTACPRIALDDSRRYSAEELTVLTPVELRIALDLKSWSDYAFDAEW